MKGVLLFLDNVIVIVGPSASGKTKVSIDLASKINGEIISADSMQIYKYMDIGTAKPLEDERFGIKHYLIDEITPDREFSVAHFQKLALKYIDEIIKKGKKPIIAGGTGLYINSLIYNIKFTKMGNDKILRNNLEYIANEKGNEFIYNILKEIDPKTANRIHVNDRRRIIRAIEVFKTTGKPMSYYWHASRSTPPPYNYIIFGLNMEREKLYDKINKRVDGMIEKGLIEEVKNLVEMGYDKCSVAMQGLGYKEMIWYLKGETTLNESVNLLKRNTRRYAKRQMTWFSKIENITWLNIDNNYSEVADKIFEQLIQNN